MASVLPKAESLCYRNLLVVIKQTAYEEYSQVRRIMYGGFFKCGYRAHASRRRVGM